MSLAPGVRLGPYEILTVIGAGGMGEVYRARDTRLNRDVAVKILPDVFAADADRVARFQHEAQVLASLNHSSIAQIHGREEAPSSTTGQVSRGCSYWSLSIGRRTDDYAGTQHVAGRHDAGFQ
jgi:serine/threonine protein kinase